MFLLKTLADFIYFIVPGLPRLAFATCGARSVSNVFYKNVIKLSCLVEAARIEIPTSTCYSLLVFIIVRKELVTTTGSFETITKTRVICENCWWVLQSYLHKNFPKVT